MYCNDNNYDLENCQDYKIEIDDEEIKANICVELKILKNFIIKDLSGQIGSFLDESTFINIKKLDTVWLNYINRKKWRGGKKIPKIVVRNLAIKIEGLMTRCLISEVKAIMRIMKENPSFEWDYKDREDGKPRVKSYGEIIHEVFS